MDLTYLASYILQSVFICGLLLTGYWLLLRNGRFHQFNRFYLLLTVMISVSAPLVKTGWFSFSPAVHEVINPVTYFTSDDNNNNSYRAGIYAKIGIGLLISISLIFLSIFLQRLYSLYQWRKKYSRTPMQGFNLVQTDLDEAPFTFLKDLYWPSSIGMETALGKKIMAHECTHIRQMHSWDRLFTQLITCIFWINPFYWILKKELNVVHEFLADASSVEEGDGRTLAEMLLLRQPANSYFSIYHTFFQSPIKRRLAMITISKKTKFSTGRKIFSLALVFVAFIFFSCSEKDHESLAPGFKTVADKEATVQEVRNPGLAAVVEEEKPIPLTILDGVERQEIRIDKSKKGIQIDKVQKGEKVLFEITFDKGEKKVIELKKDN